MLIKSNIKKVAVVGELPKTLEGVELALQNAERLFYDSQNVSIPTKVALLEIGLEEVAKAWGIVLSYEKSLLDNNPDSMKIYLESAHIETNEIPKNIIQNIKKFFSENDPNSFLTPFDTKTWSDHYVKIKFLSKFIRYVREIALPLSRSRSSSDRVKTTKEILGRYISKNRLTNLKEYDKIIDDILDVDDNQLTDIVNLKGYGLYVDVENNVYISPNSRSYETETLENLLTILIEMVKNELSLLFIVLKKKSVDIKAKK